MLGLAISRDKSFEDLVLSIAEKGQDEDFVIDFPALGWDAGKTEEKLHESWKSSAISNKVEALIPVLESMEAKGFKRRRVDTPPPLHSVQQLEQDRGPSGYSEYNAQLPLTNPSPQRQYGLPAPDFGLPYQTTDPQMLQDLAFRAAVPRHLPERAGRLLDSYFTYTHCWLPFIERHDILRLSYRYPDISGDLAPGSPGTGEAAALWALLAYADHPTIDSSNMAGNEFTTEQLYLAARALIPPERSLFEIGHVQALLIMVLYHMRYASLNAAWFQVGQAIRIAITLGLDKPSQPLEFSDQPRKVGGRDTHVFLACFTLDTLLAGRLNRLPHLRRDSLLHLGPLFEDGPEEWEPWIDPQTITQSSLHFRNPSFTTSTFNRLIEVLVVLNEVICNTSLGLDWEKQHAALRARLTDTATRFRNRAQRQSNQTLPHHAVLHLLHMSTLAYMRLHTLSHSQNKRSALGVSPMSAQLTSQLQQCLDVFGSVQHPPLLGFSALLALKEDEAFSSGLSMANDTQWKEQLLDIAIKLEVRNNGFREIQNAIALSKFSALAHTDPLVTQPVVPKKSFIDNEPTRFWSTPTQESPQYTNTRSESIATPNLRRESSSQFDVGRFDGAGTHIPGASPSKPSKHMTGGEFGDIGPFETVTAIIAETPPAISAEIDTTSSHTKENATGGAGLPSEPQAEDGDAAFLSLAHLDTTQWSSNWEDGLVELGFANDSVFREFCNDPDRLLSDEGK
ncbi:hypothetical protein BP5796_00798 [Coleophoma crateriformis]|uniref:Xylanolytic transcriptional activator regulatory domain-containing protein n=1 Tax=Coleophoma crateriformis TaxID=565419 RepID=A0A3D8T929_9HELO|nr:hypothetical protein BP5796_00798 [Coleophoma crateriformis]